MGRQVFVSYSRKDEEYTLKLVHELRERGFEVWIDARIDFGERWWRTIVEKIESCTAFVVVMTPDSERSEWVEREVHLAIREGKPIFPLLLRGRGFALLIDRQYVNVTDSRMPPASFFGRLGREVTGRDVELEDLRPTITVGGIELVPIPAGEFTMGSDTGYDDEKPVHEVYVDAFHIGKYPITNVQYKRFVEAAGHRAARHWSGGAIPGGKENHPVVNVSWHDCRAYCQWLAEESGQVVRLPTEAEWEKAARGTDGREYPWGSQFDKDKCNTEESDIGDTTPVGKYSPEGDSPYGVTGMAGNVWEWTSTLKQDYPYDPDDGREDPEEVGLRVLRGGSFYSILRLVRCACRYGRHPDARFSFFGFRVVVSPGSP